METAVVGMCSPADVYQGFEDGGCILFLVSCGGVRLSPLGTSATNWPIVPAPDDR
jgi:hypothetical protein